MAKASLRKYRAAIKGGSSTFRIFGAVFILVVVYLWLRTILTSDLFTHLLNGSPTTIMSAVEQAAVSAAKPFEASAASSSSSSSSSSTTTKSSSLSSKIRSASRITRRIDNDKQVERQSHTKRLDVVAPKQIKRGKEEENDVVVQEEPLMESEEMTTTTTTTLIESKGHAVDSPLSLPDGSVTPRDNDPFFGSQIDLDGHRSNDQCWEHFDFGMLEEWDATNAVFCAPISSDNGEELTALQARDLLPPGVTLDAVSTQSSLPVNYERLSWLRCRVTVDSHLPPPTAPHTMCDGANIVFDTNLLQPTQCLDSRSGYKCDGPPVHWRFLRGAFSPSNPNGCKLLPPFNPSSFPQDHLRDMFSSFSPTHSESVLPSASIGKVVLLFARERAEHANPFHATTDFMNAFFSLHLAGVLNGVTGSRDGIEKVQVLLLDEQIGPYDNDFISTVFSPKFEVQRVSSLKKSGNNKILLQHAIFSPPGYSNFFLAHVDSDGDCHAGTQLLQSFRRFVLSAFPSTLPLLLPRFADPALDPIVVTLISRRPYDRFVQHSFIGRQIDNEDELILALSSEPGVVVTRHDFAQFKSVEEQLAVIAKTEVLVAMHGAALTYAIYLPSHASVLEFWPKASDMWRCFEHIAAMSGLQYVRWANPDPSAFRVDQSGDYTRIDLQVVSKRFSELVKGARERRTESRK